MHLSIEKKVKGCSHGQPLIFKNNHLLPMYFFRYIHDDKNEKYQGMQKGIYVPDSGLIVAG